MVSLAQPAFQGPCPGTGLPVNPDGTCGASSSIGSLLANIQQLINSIVPVLIALGVVYFVWGVVRFMIGDTEEAKTKGKDTIVYGIIGFAIIIGLWGLVNIVVNTLGFGGAGALTPPTLTTVAAAPEGTCTMGTNIQGLLGFFVCLINNSIIPLIFAIAVVMFIWGAVKFFIINADEEAQREQGKQFMIWGIIALTVMTTVWGIVGVLGDTFNLKRNALPQVCPPGSTQCDKQ
ncbi:MAG: pilin [bacterium]|nr:pilin [bacterium]